MTTAALRTGKLGSAGSSGPVASTLPVTTLNNVRVYNISGNAHRVLPDWLVRRSARSLKKDAEWTKRVELIQDLEFPEASLQAKFTKDGKYLVATGTYKPQFRVFELAEMSMKFERHTDSETVGFEILSDDWTKLALLQANRSVEFHGPSGCYHMARLPRVGRAMLYDEFSCDMIVGASDTNVYRLNLDRGQFMAPFETDQYEGLGVNCIDKAPLHGLYGFGTESGTVEFWDRRDRKRIGVLGLKSLHESDSDKFEVSSLRFMPDGITWVAGTSTGQVSLFDLRSTRPLLSRDHHYGFAIKDIQYHNGSGSVLSYDKKSIRIWNKSTGAMMTTVEPSGNVDLNHVCQSPERNDGFLLCSVEDRQMQSFFIPALGPAPRWASFLENLTEEMEEGVKVGAKTGVTTGAVYDNYKFVTKQELSALNLDHLIGTSVLRAYMHGYFVDLRLWEKAKSIANPFAFEEYLEEQRKAKLDAERASRIKTAAAGKKTVLPGGVKAKVNNALAERLQKQSELLTKLDSVMAEEPSTSAVTEESSELTEEPVKHLSKSEKRAIKAAKSSKAILADPRFSSLFTNPDFAVDEESHEFKLLNPVAADGKARSRAFDDEDD